MTFRYARQSSTYDFLLVIHSNYDLSPIPFRDKRRYTADLYKIAKRLGVDAHFYADDSQT